MGSNFVELVTAHPHTPGCGSRSREYIQSLLCAHSAALNGRSWEPEVELGAIGMDILRDTVDWGLYAEIQKVAREAGEEWKAERWLLGEFIKETLRRVLAREERSFKPPTER